MKTNKTLPPYATKILEVDLGAIAYNYRVLCQYLKPETLCGAVLKADAYGLGQDAIMQCLIKESCQHFFFAFVEEAIQARALFPNPAIKIYILNGVFEHCESLFTQHNLIPCLISMEQIFRWAAHSKKMGQKLPCLLHIDTGMGREGLSFKDFKILLTAHEDILKTLDIQYLMSHMANSNYPPSPKNQEQLQNFKEVMALLPGIKGSFSNSSAMFLGPDFQFDLARPGMALYGYKQCYIDALHFKTTISAKAKVLLTRTIYKGHSIGYDGIYTAQRKTDIALVCVGHNDGILRAASNQGSVIINGIRAPIIGRVSMDLIMVDITDHPHDGINTNTWATLYDDYKTTHAFAESEGTSVYELFVRHGKRYYRCYK